VRGPGHRIARASAGRLASDYGPQLPAQVEAALHTRGSQQRPGQYADPVSIANLLVSIATLAWTIYMNLKEKTPHTSPEVMARTIRVELRTQAEDAPAAQDKIIEIVVAEVIKAAADRAGTRTDTEAPD
jgi:hypothetical protein